MKLYSFIFANDRKYKGNFVEEVSIFPNWTDFIPQCNNEKRRKIGYRNTTAEHIFSLHLIRECHLKYSQTVLRIYSDLYPYGSVSYLIAYFIFQRTYIISWKNLKTKNILDKYILCRKKGRQKNIDIFTNFRSDPELDPDPLFNQMDQWIRMSIKMKRNRRN